MERWLASLACAGAFGLGCTGKGTVDIDLVHASFEDPYRGLDRLHASVLDASGNAIVARDLDPFGPSLELDGLEPGTDRVVRLEGFAGTQLRARGESAPLAFASGSQQRVPVTFSTLPVAVALPVKAFYPGAILIDGKLDEWAAAPVAAELHPANASLGTPKNDADLSAKIYLAWDANGLYVAMHVFDNCVVCDTGNPDKVIVSWDGHANRETGFYGADDGNATAGVSLIETTGSVEAAAAKAGGGYAVEFRISNADMDVALLEHAMRVGFEVELFDGGGGAYNVVEAWLPSPDPLARRPFPAEMGTIGIVEYP